MSFVPITVVPECLCCIALKGHMAMQICTLKIPTREAKEADIMVPRQAPQAIADLMAACHQSNPRDRPRIGDICDILESLDDKTQPLSASVTIQM